MFGFSQCKNLEEIYCDNCLLDKYSIDKIIEGLRTNNTRIEYSLKIIDFSKN
jgi:hypothetical protein